MLIPIVSFALAGPLRTFGSKRNHMRWVLLLVVLLSQATFASSDQRNWDSLSWSTVPRGVAFTAGVVGMFTMIVSGLVVADGVQEGCEKDYRGEVSCRPDEDQVVSGLRWMGAGAILTVVGSVAYASIDFIDRSIRNKGGPEEPKGVPRQRIEEDVGIPIPAAP